MGENTMIIIGDYYNYLNRPLGQGFICEKVFEKSINEVSLKDAKVFLASQTKNIVYEYTKTDENGIFRFINLDENDVFFVFAHYPCDDEGSPVSFDMRENKTPKYQSEMAAFLVPEVGQ